MSLPVSKKAFNYHISLWNKKIKSLINLKLFSLSKFFHRYELYIFCSQLSICSPRQISLHYDIVKEFFKIEFERGGTGKEPNELVKL